MAGLLMGSVASQVSAHAACPAVASFTTAGSCIR